MEYQDYLRTRKPFNPVLLEVMKQMKKNGDFEGMGPDEQLEAAVTATERLLEK